MVQKAGRRRRLTATRRKAVVAHAQVPDVPIGEPQHLVSGRLFERPLWYGTEGLRCIAQLLWLPDYARLFEFEVLHNLEFTGGSVGGALQLACTSQRANKFG